MKFKNSTTLIILEGVVIIALVIVLGLRGGGLRGTVLSPDKAAQNAINYINENFMSGEDKMILSEVEETSGVYKVKVKIGEEEDIIFITKDGRFLWQRPLDLQPPEPKSFPQTKKPNVELFVMAFCPHGNQAEEVMMPVVDLLKDKADIQLHYIFDSDYLSGYPEYCLDKENKYCSMHGIQEVNQDIRELCVWKNQKDKFWDFVKEINAKTTAQNVDDKWETIARELEIDVQTIKSCQESEAIALSEKEMELTSAKYPVQDPAHPNHGGNEEESISGSPTLVINGMIYDGGRTPEEFKQAICAAFEKPPAECEQTLENDGPGGEGAC